MTAADYYHMQVSIITVPGGNSLQTTSKWAFLSDSVSLLQTNGIRKAHKAKLQNKRIQMWTDTYSNLFQLIKFNSGGS
jgi:hypothetical protein